MPLPRLILPLLLLTSLPCFAQFTDVINSNRPGESMAAFSVGKTVIQAELGIYGQNEDYAARGYDGRGWGTDLMLRYGEFFEQFEMILELQYQRDKFATANETFTRNGIRQAVLGAKYLIYDPNKNYEKKPDLYSWKRNHAFSWREFIPAVGVYAGVNLNLFNSPYYGLNEEKISPKVMVLTQNQFGKWVFVSNIYADRIITNYMTFGYIATLTRGINERWSAFIENQGIKSDQYSDGIIRLGAAFLAYENIQFDASLGKSFKNSPDVMTAGIGVSWRFDDNYTEVLLRAPKEETKEDKEKKKKKDKERKRIDEIEGGKTD